MYQEEIIMNYVNAKQMSNKTNEEWAEQQYQNQLDKMSGVDEEPTPKKEADPDSYRDNLEDR
jgi:hypothetical protein